MRYIKIDIDEKIKFTRRTKMYGVAYFDFCFKIDKKGKIKKVFITPKQQIDQKHGWVMECGNSSGYFIKSPDYPYGEEWGNIQGFYCTHHRSICISIVTPKNSSMLYCDHIGANVWFKFK